MGTNKSEFEKILEAMSEIQVAQRKQSPGNWSKLLWEVDQVETIRDILDNNQ